MLVLLTVGALQAQTTVNKTVPVQSGQKIKLMFDYPSIKVSTWDKNEISIQGKVSINGGENDDAFVIQSKTSGNTLVISSDINGFKNLPQRITIRESKGSQKMVFRNKAEWKKYADEHGRTYFMMNEGVDIDITLEIKVPRNMETLVDCVYGMVEVKDFVGPLTVKATYGGVDAALIEETTGELVAETNYGHIYSDLNFSTQKKNVQEEDFHTYVSAKPGSGPKYSFESQYGNVYLRKIN